MQKDFLPDRLPQILGWDLWHFCTCSSGGGWFLRCLHPRQYANRFGDCRCLRQRRWFGTVYGSAIWFGLFRSNSSKRLELPWWEPECCSQQFPDSQVLTNLRLMLSWVALTNNYVCLHVQQVHDSFYRGETSFEENKGSKISWGDRRLSSCEGKYVKLGRGVDWAAYLLAAKLGNPHIF